MKVRRAHRSTRWMLAAAASLAFGTQFLAQAASAPLQLTVSLDGPARITQGEPIVISYRIANNSDTPRIVFEQSTGPDWLKDREQPAGPRWLTESLVDAAGHAVSQVTQFDPQQFAGGVQVKFGISPVPAQGTQEGYEVINQGFAVPPPGKYTLTVHATLLNSYDAEVAGPQDESTLVETFSLPLVVAPANPKQLKADAQALTTAILEKSAGTDFGKRAMQLRSLFSLPDAVAVPYWRQLAQQHVDVADELYRVHTATAADVLASVAADKSDLRTGVTYLTRMQWMCDTGDDALKQYITALYSQYGIDARFRNVVTN